MALLADPALLCGNLTGKEDNFSSDSNVFLQAFQEEDHSDMNDEKLERFFFDAVDILPKYREMIRQLQDKGGTLFYSGIQQDYEDLENRFDDFGLKILGPTAEHLNICFENLTSDADGVADFMKSADSDLSLGRAYRQISEKIITDNEEGLQSSKH